MSVFGIATTIASQFGALVSQGSKPKQFAQEFQQIGQDLQSGNISQAQTDFSALQQILPGGQQTSTVAFAPASQTNNPLGNAVSQLAQDLKSGNAKAAQSDLSTVQQDLQQANQTQESGQARHHHRHHAHSGSGQSSANANEASQLFGQLGQSLQSGNLSAAQQAYASLQQEFQQFAPAASPASASLSVAA